MVPSVSSIPARAVTLLAALTVGFSLPGAAVAQFPAPQLPGLTEEPPPWRGGENDESREETEPGGEAPDRSADDADEPTAGELPRTGSEPLLLGLSGAALALLGTGLRLRTLDADLF